MVEHVRVGAKKDAVQDRSCTEDSKELDVDLVLRHMKKVGYIDSEGYTVLPKYYDV